MQRRDFVRTAALSGAALIISGCQGPLAPRLKPQGRASRDMAIFDAISEAGWSMGGHRGTFRRTDGTSFEGFRIDSFSNGSETEGRPTDRGWVIAVDGQVFESSPDNYRIPAGAVWEAYWS